jgi:pimeloyl-ACP methyl ester carboxylesterase
VRVQHRHVIYVQGYDPRGLAQYYRMFRTELRKFGRLYQLAATISKLKTAPDGETASWSIESKGPDETSAANWQTRTDYDFLRFEDLIQRDLQWPIWRTLSFAIAIYWRLVFSGTIARFWRAHWRFATFISYPHVLLLTEAVVSLAAAFAFGAGLEALGVPGFLAVPAGAAVFVAVLGTILKTTENLTYLLYLLSDTIFTWQFAHRERPEWDQRIERFARHLVGVARATDAQEIVVVGHSSGSFLGVDIVARALELDPDLGRHGPRIVLLTIGGNLPIVGFHAAATGFREHLRRLAVEPSIDWIDCQSRKDVMNFHPFDPIAGHGIDVGTSKRNPTIVPVRFRDIIRPENYNRFRWKFFRVHFQFVMANERPHPYDFFMIVCGPVPLRERMADPAAALALATGDSLTRENAWKRLESGPDLADRGQMEPSARLRG